MSSTNRRMFKHDSKPNPLVRRLTIKKSRGKSREGIMGESMVYGIPQSRHLNVPENSKLEGEESAVSEQPNVDHRKEIFSAFYDSLLQSIVAEREIVVEIEEAAKGETIDEKENTEDSEVDVDEDEVPATTSKTNTDSMIRPSSAKINSFKDQPSSMISKKSDKLSQETDQNIMSESASTCEEKPKPTIEKIVFKNGNIYEGETYCGLIKGNGIFHWNDGTVYEGQFKNGFPTGEGKMVLSDLSIYEGNFCNGYFHGKGVLNITSTPLHYSGNWKNGMKHGNGWLLYEAENWYEGNWFEDTKSGVGYRRYKTGCKYKGNWNNNIKKGQGKMMWKNNDYYDGEWSENLPNGYGEYTWSTVYNKSLCFPLYNWYKGSWVDGNRTGVGIMNFGTECGSKLGGTWYHNRKQGPGVMMCGNGRFIECNPLFHHDKPVHMSSRKSLNDIAEEENIDVSSLDTTTKRDSFKDISALISNKVALRKFPDEIILNITKNGLDLQGNNFMKLYDSISGTKKMWCPLKIPIHSVAEDVDLTYYINISFEYLCDEQKNLASAMALPQKSKSKVYSLNFGSSTFSEKSAVLSNIPCDTSTFKEEEKSKLKDEEAFFLRNQIIINLTRLTQIYNLYASFTKRNSLSFKPILTRLFLWQLIRDVHLANEGVSLVQADLMLSKNPASCTESDHYPFEPIYFYQYIQTLVGCSWLMFLAGKLPCYVIFGGGFLANIFKTFLEEFVYPNAGNFTGSVLTENIDTVPITAIYNLYVSLGEPLSVRMFLNATCTKKGTEPPCYYTIDPENDQKELKNGHNAVTIANEIHYIPANDADNNVDNVVEESPNKRRDPFCKTLYVFRNFGKKTLTHCMARVCPKIIGPSQTTDLTYKLTFLEFYEVLLKCALMKAEEIRRDQELQLRETQKLFAIQKHSISALSKTKEKVAKKKKSKKSILTF